MSAASVVRRRKDVDGPAPRPGLVLGRVLARLLVGGVWIAAGVIELPDPAESVRAVRAYDLLPEAIVPTVGYGLPAVEIVIGTLMILGLGLPVGAPRPLSCNWSSSSGSASAWARELGIDCSSSAAAELLNASDKYPWKLGHDASCLTLVGGCALSSHAPAWRLDSLLSLDKEVSTHDKKPASRRAASTRCRPRRKPPSGDGGIWWWAGWWPP